MRDCVLKQGERMLGNLEFLHFNRALLDKLYLEVWMESDAFRKAIISLKYGMKDGGWFSKGVRGSYGVGLWEEIFKEGPYLKLNNSSVLGVCSRIKFWEDT